MSATVTAERLCLCGCGEVCNRGARWVKNHWRQKQKPLDLADTIAEIDNEQLTSFEVTKKKQMAAPLRASCAVPGCKWKATGKALDVLRQQKAHAKMHAAERAAAKRLEGARKGGLAKAAAREAKKEAEEVPPQYKCPPECPGNHPIGLGFGNCDNYARMRWRNSQTAIRQRDKRRRDKLLRSPAGPLRLLVPAD